MRGTIVIKFGGSLLETGLHLEAFIQEIAQLRNEGQRIILVHGGGKHISHRLDQMSIDQEFSYGYRVTSKEAIGEVEMVLSGHINKQLVMHFNNVGIAAVGISGKDGQMIHAKKKTIKDVELGYVGEIKTVDTKLIKTLLDGGFMPIISTIGADDFGNTLNINADDVAGALAAKLKSKKLIFMTDVEGYFSDYEDKESLVSWMKYDEVSSLLKSGDLVGGMIPKLYNSKTALEGGCLSVHIMNGEIADNVSRVIGGEKIGTTIGGINV